MSQKNIMCVICFNSQWRSVVIGTISGVITLLSLLLSLAYHDQILLYLKSSSSMESENNCVYHQLFKVFYPWPLWITLLLYACLNIILVVSATYKWIPGVIFYLASDALFLGLMATALCLSFFPEGLLRIALLTLLFPLLSLALCAWMTVFGFYLRLEDIAKRKRKREQVQKALERTFKEDADDVWVYHTRQSNQGTMEFVNLAFEPGKPDDQLKS